MTKLLRLGEFAEVSAGNSAPQDESLFKNGTLPFVRTSDVGVIHIGGIESSRDLLTPEGARGLKLFPAGTILFPKSGASTFLNHRVILNTSAYVSSHLATIKAKSDVALDRYIFYFLQTIDARDLCQDQSYPSLNRDQISGIEVPLPSLDEQQIIVEKLDSAFAEIDLLEDLHSKRKSELVAELFEAFRDSLLTSVCAEIPAVEFGNIGYFVRGPFGGSLKKSIFKQSGIAVYEQQHAIYNTFKSFRYFIDDGKFQEMKRFEVKPNDLIMSCSGTYGKIAVVPEDAPEGIINQALLKITPGKGVQSQFIKHWMQSSLFQAELDKEVGGTALQNVPSVAKMKTIKIRLPEEHIQIRTIERLEEFLIDVELAKVNQGLIKENHIALRKSILNSAFSESEAVA